MSEWISEKQCSQVWELVFGMAVLNRVSPTIPGSRVFLFWQMASLKTREARQALVWSWRRLAAGFHKAGICHPCFGLYLWMFEDLLQKSIGCVFHMAGRLVFPLVSSRLWSSWTSSFPGAQALSASGVCSRGIWAFWALITPHIWSSWNMAHVGTFWGSAQAIPEPADCSVFQSQLNAVSSPSQAPSTTPAGSMNAFFRFPFC